MMPTTGGTLLLLLASTDRQSVAQLATASHLSPTETLHRLTRLVEQGFLVLAAPDDTIAVYQLNPKRSHVETADPHRRILLIEDDVAVQELLHLILDDAGYAVVIVRTPVDATALLDAIAFDLVITDGFSRTPTAIVTNTLAVLTAAGATPVALFTAHQLELDAARAAGFRDLIAKPFELDVLEQQVRVLLQ